MWYSISLSHCLFDWVSNRAERESVGRLGGLAVEIRGLL